jgi:hypothetical protein
MADDFDGCFAPSQALWSGPAMTLIQQPQPRRTHGCLWGCLAVLAFLFLPVLLAVGYSAWFFYEGYRRDPVLRGVVELVRHDGMAEMVLGDDIHITGIEGSALSHMWGEWDESGGSYVVDLAGSKGQGTLSVTAVTRNGRLSVQRMILDGPHGAHYDLLRHTGRPGDSPTDSI